jgi:hypothetical protein
MYDYTIVPDEKLKKRMDFFYTPYNPKFLLRKHMVFEEEEEKLVMSPNEAAAFLRSQNDAIGSVNLQSPRRTGDLERMSKQVNFTDAAKNTQPVLSDGPENESGPTSARDKKKESGEMTKELQEKLQKKEWGTMKHLIFHTEEKVLDYLQFHTAKIRERNGSPQKTSVMRKSTLNKPEDLS